MIIARIANTRVSHSHEPEAEERSEIGRKLAIVTGVAGLESEIGVIVRKAAIEKPVIVRQAHVTRSSNDNEDRTELGRKLAMVAGIV